MLGIVVGLIVVPLVDQALKRFLRQRAVRVTPSPIWLQRFGIATNRSALWLAWCIGAAGVAGVTVFAPEAAWFAGLMLGGSLSHAIENARSGHVIDYLYLRFWPAFNLADAAIAVGGIGVIAGVLAR